MKPSAALLSDLRGGLVAAVVVLPQATAFGATVFAPWLGAAPGALAGSTGAIVLLLIAGAIGGAVGLISGPTGPSMTLLAGATAVLVAAGVAPAATDRFKRLAIYGPGTVFGEIAFLDPGPRAAEAVAVRPSELLVLGRADFNQLRIDYPDAAIALLLALSRLQSRSLRWSAKEIQRLIQW